MGYWFCNGEIVSAEAQQLYEPEEIVEQAAGEGSQRLSREGRDIFITAVIGGVEVSLGGLAAMTVLGSSMKAIPSLGLYGGLALAGLIFPVGFFFVIMGRSELYTENFLIPVVAILQRQQPLRTLGPLWGMAWLGNMLGCALMALIVSVPEAIGKPIIAGYAAYADYKLSLSPLGVLFSALLAGMTMTVLTWLLIALRHPLARITALWAAGYVLFATNMSHTVVGAALIFVGTLPSHHTWLETAIWVALTTIGNTVGGVAVVTFFRYSQFRAKKGKNPISFRKRQVS